MEFIGTVQFTRNEARGNPVALYMEQTEGEYRISARLPQWRHIVGAGATANKAAGNYETNLKAAVPAEGAYEGPYWNAGIKPEKPAPPKPAAGTPAPPSPVTPSESGTAPSA
jgi:hypothetical protein